MMTADELKQEIDLENRAQNEDRRSINLPDSGKFTTSKQRIYPVTEGIQSKHTRLTYQQNFDRFLNKINIHDRQVLLDFSPKVIKEMIIDYIHYLSEEIHGCIPLPKTSDNTTTTVMPATSIPMYFTNSWISGI